MKQKYGYHKMFAFDIETTRTLPGEDNDVRTWLVCLANFSGTVRKDYRNLNDFMDYILNMRDNCEFYAHNLKFEYKFMIDYLMRVKTNFEFVDESAGEKLRKKTFSHLMSDMGQLYTVKIMNRYGKTITFYDSFKVLSFSLEDIAKKFKYEQVLAKGIDHSLIRPIGYEPTADELAHCYGDVDIVIKFMKEFIENFDFQSMTTSGEALRQFKLTLGNGDFKLGKQVFLNKFPVLAPEVDTFCRLSYMGGYTALGLDYQEENRKRYHAGEKPLRVYNGSSYDINSAYPHSMMNALMPYGDPIIYPGKPKHLNLKGANRFYISKVTVVCELKDGVRFPMNIGRNGKFTKDMKFMGSWDPVTLHMSIYDIDTLFKYYHVTHIEYHETYEFQCSNKVFREYISKYMKQKKDAEKRGDIVARNHAKLMLNALYGKFGTNPSNVAMLPFVKDSKEIGFRKVPRDDKDTVYIPVAVSVTAFVRNGLIDVMNSDPGSIYCDTDSAKFNHQEIPKNMWIDPLELGAWKHEGNFDVGIFLAPKTYMTGNKSEDGNYITEVVGAGMTKDVKLNFDLDNFDFGVEIRGSKKSKTVKGGLVINDGTFMIKPPVDTTRNPIGRHCKIKDVFCNLRVCSQHTH